MNPKMFNTPWTMNGLIWFDVVVVVLINYFRLMSLLRWAGRLALKGFAYALLLAFCFHWWLHSFWSCIWAWLDLPSFIPLVILSRWQGKFKCINLNRTSMINERSRVFFFLLIYSFLQYMLPGWSNEAAKKHVCWKTVNSHDHCYYCIHIHLNSRHLGI